VIQRGLTRRLLAVLLLIAASLMLSGLVFWKESHRLVVGKWLVQLMPNGWFETLVIAESDLNQLRFEHPFEFEYQGTMFDVVFKTTKGDSIYFTVYRDNHETHLNAAIAATQTFSTSGGPVFYAQNLLAQFFNHLKKADCTNASVTEPGFFCLSPSVWCVFIFYPAVTLFPDTPPPEYRI
jgi:hypothetical protein